MNRHVARFIACAALAAAALGFAGAGWAADVKSETLDAVKKRGQLICGVDTGIPGFAFQDSKPANGRGSTSPIAAPSPPRCSAIAEKVKYIGTTVEGPLLGAAIGRDRRADPRFRAHLHPQHRSSASTSRRVNFFTGQTFMVKKSLNVAHVKELNGATICVLTGTTLETNIADYNRANNIKINTLLFDKSGGGLRRRRGRALRRLYRRRRQRRGGALDDEEAGRLGFLPETDLALQPLGSYTPPGRRALDRIW